MAAARVVERFRRQLKVYRPAGGNTGAQMGGWSARRSTPSQTSKGLKLRIGGFAGKVAAKLGVIPQQIAGGDIDPALEKGTSMPPSGSVPMTTRSSASTRLRNLLLPGWWEGGASCTTYDQPREVERAAEEPINSIVLEAALPPDANHACWRATTANNPTALRRLVADGAQFRPFTQAILDACFKAAQRSLRRDHRDECGLQEDLGLAAGVQRRRVPVVRRSPSIATTRS